MDAANLKSSAPGSEGQWFETLISYLGANKNISWSYWDMAEDEYALLNGNWDTTPVSAEKQQMLKTIEFRLAGTKTSTTAPPAGLKATAVSPAEIDLAWTPSTTVGVTYNVYATSGPTLAVSAVDDGCERADGDGLSEHRTEGSDDILVCGGSGERERCCVFGFE